MKSRYAVPYIKKSTHDFSIRICTFYMGQERDEAFRELDLDATFKVAFDIRVLWRTVYVMLSIWKETS